MATGQYTQFPIDWKSLDASKVPYSNTSSGLTATDVQNALDELNTDLNAIDASDVPYDNTASGMTADDVQEAIDELHTGEVALDYSKAPVIVDTASGSIASFPDGADGYPLKECVFQIDAVQSGSGDPSPDNVRPITGWSEANVTRTGKNLLDVAGRTFGNESSTTIALEGCTAVKDGDKITATITGAWSKLRFGLNASDFKVGQTYTLSAKFSNPSGRYVGLAYFDTAWRGTRVTQDTDASVSISFVFDPSINKIALILNNSGSSTGATVVCTEIQIALGEIVAPYVPYVNSQTVTINLGGTRYGGTLDVQRGKLSVTWAGVTVNSFSGTAEENGFRTTTTLDNYGGGAYGELMCNMFTRGTSYLDIVRSGQNKIGVNSIKVVLLNGYANGQYLSLAEINALIPQGGCQLVYPLATPIEVDLTPTEITTLLGQNNLWSDTGDVEVEYCCSTRLFIEKKLAELMA